MSNETPRPDELKPVSPPVADGSMSQIPDDYVLVFDAPDYETGEIVRATLISEGLHAVLANPELGPGANALPALGNTWSHAVFVAPGDLEAATAILAALPPSEAELAAAQAADPTTLEQAEKIVRDA